MTKQKNVYIGPERRTRPINDRRCCQNCSEHSGMLEKICALEGKANTFENAGFLTISTYRWTTSVLLSILLSVLSASVYFTFQTVEALREVRISQDSITMKMDFLKADIEVLKKKAP